jgi:hypothetical protein
MNSGGITETDARVASGAVGLYRIPLARPLSDQTPPGTR